MFLHSHTVAWCLWYYSIFVASCYIHYNLASDTNLPGYVLYIHHAVFLPPTHLVIYCIHHTAAFQLTRLVIYCICQT